MSKILIIEDETSLLDLYAEVLAAENYTVLKASSGEEGAKLAISENWDVLFLDVMLPGVDGIEILKRLNNENILGDRAVIMLTSLDSPNIVGECMKYGAKEFLSKPDITPEVLVNIAEKYTA